MTYLTFLLWYVVPIIVVASIVILQTGQVRKIHLGAIATLMGLAFTYATPWDNYLVARGIWTYPPGAVLFTIGYVPIEEYLFFLLQPLLTGLWTVFLVRNHPPIWKRMSYHTSYGGVGVGIVMTLIGALMVVWSGHWLYMGLILVWVGPIFTLHWAVGGQHLIINRNLLALAILPSTVYLCSIDAIAIHRGLWHITEATSTGWMIFNLPIEEALFFLLTNVMVVQGILLYVWVVDAGVARRVWQRVNNPQATLQRIQQ